MKTSSLRMAIAIVLMLSLVLTACSKSQTDNVETANNGAQNQEQGSGNAADSKYGGILKIASGEGPLNLGHPASVITVADIMIGTPVMETLGRYNEKGELEPFLAESWDIDSENNTITYVLKKGIRFHDGTDFNAEAVKWNFDEYRNANLGLFDTNDTTSVEVVDEYTVRIHLKEWNSSLFEKASTIIMASPAAYEKLGKDGLNANPVGTGPFIFDSWDRDVVIKFKKNPDYWQEGKPYLDGIEWHFVADPITAESAFVNGDFHVLSGATPNTAMNLEKDFDVLLLSNGNGAAGYAMAFDSVNPDSPFADVKVRQAVGYAIDRETIMDTIYHGYVIPSNQWALPGISVYNDEVEGTPYNPEKAKELLAEAGYPDGFQTKATFINTPDNEMMFTAIQGYLEKVGIRVELNPVTVGAWVDMTSGGGWDGIINAVFKAESDVTTMMLFMGVSGESVYFTKTKREPKLDQLLTEAQRAKTLDDKFELMRQAQKVMIDELAMNYTFGIASAPVILYPEVQDTGFNKAHLVYWEPENAWMKK